MNITPDKIDNFITGEDAFKKVQNISKYEKELLKYLNTIFDSINDAIKCGKIEIEYFVNRMFMEDIIRFLRQNGFLANTVEIGMVENTKLIICWDFQNYLQPDTYYKCGLVDTNTRRKLK